MIEVRKQRYKTNEKEVNCKGFCSFKMLSDKALKRKIETRKWEDVRLE